MATKLVSGRVLVLLDQGKDDRGVIFQSNLDGYIGLAIPREPPVDPDDPMSPLEFYDHVIFVKNMSETVTIGGVDYQAMHRNAIIAVIE